jgi:putative MFS transporter
MWAAVVVAALGYFVDIFDILLFSIVRVPSLTDIGVPADKIFSEGIFILNLQLIGLLLGGVVWGVWADKIGRLSVLYGSILIYSVANIACAFVHSVELYAIYRFIAGFGLAGELGAGITLVSELLPKDKRGWGATIVTGFGLLGAVVAGILAEIISWRTCYLIGGILGFLLLVARIKVSEGEAFTAIKNNSDIKKGSLILLFSSIDRIKRYVLCVLLGAPIMAVVYVLATFAPEIGKHLNFSENLTAAKSVMYTYIGITIGDFIWGFVSQTLKSRKSATSLSLLFAIFLTGIAVIFPPLNASYFYLYTILFGIASANWAIILSTCAESFGTNIRATATTSIPNVIRGGAIIVVMVFSLFKSTILPWDAAILTILICIAVAFFANKAIKETFGVSLSFTEK